MLLWVLLFCRLYSPMMHLEVFQLFNEVQPMCSHEDRANEDILGHAAGALTTNYVKMDY